mmetsp:Transcript_124145/g.397348  ORF Transcript_124145/g.397348 Transcript_124145/m.397348 type:complete len:208 (+) Transcript_124145:843-1466(+)
MCRESCCLSRFRLCFSKGGHKWQKGQPPPVAQPFVWKKAQGLHLPAACKRLPADGSPAAILAEPPSRPFGGGAPTASAAVAVGPSAAGMVAATSGPAAAEDRGLSTLRSPSCEASSSQAAPPRPLLRTSSSSSARPADADLTGDRSSSEFPASAHRAARPPMEPSRGARVTAAAMAGVRNLAPNAHRQCHKAGAPAHHKRRGGTATM